MELGVWTQDIPCPWAVRAGRTLRGSVALGSLQDPSKEAGDFGDPLGRAPRAAVAQWPGNFPGFGEALASTTRT